jgi:RNA polymerase-binding transcription factor DksA
MDIAALFLTLAVLTLVSIYLAQPYLDRRSGRGGKPDHVLSALLAEYDRTVSSLQEIDFDYTLGKIPTDDFPGQRAALLARGAEVLRQLDSLQSQSEHQDAQNRLEAAVVARRADASVQKTGIALEDDDLEALIAKRRKSHKQKSAGFCPRCGKPILTSDRFCPSCGKAIT